MFVNVTILFRQPLVTIIPSAIYYSWQGNRALCLRFSFLCLFSRYVDTDKMIFPNLILVLHIQGSVPTNYLSTNKQTTNNYNDESNVLSGAVIHLKWIIASTFIDVQFPYPAKVHSLREHFKYLVQTFTKVQFSYPAKVYCLKENFDYLAYVTTVKYPDGKWNSLLCWIICSSLIPTRVGLYWNNWTFSKRRKLGAILKLEGLSHI